MGDRHVETLDDVVPYLQRVVRPELIAIRSLLDLMRSNGDETAVSFGDDIHLGTAAPSAVFIPLSTAAAVLSRQVRCVFTVGTYPAINLAKTRNIYLEYWLSASAGGGTPEVALFNAGTGVQIAGSDQVHTGGVTALAYLKGPLVVGDGTDELPTAETVYSIGGRDLATLVNPIIGQARFLVRYE